MFREFLSCFLIILIGLQTAPVLASGPSPQQRLLERIGGIQGEYEEIEKLRAALLEEMETYYLETASQEYSIKEEAQVFMETMEYMGLLAKRSRSQIEKRLSRLMENLSGESDLKTVREEVVATILSASHELATGSQFGSCRGGQIMFWAGFASGITSSLILLIGTFSGETISNGIVRVASFSFLASIFLVTIGSVFAGKKC